MRAQDSGLVAGRRIAAEPRRRAIGRSAVAPIFFTSREESSRRSAARGQDRGAVRLGDDSALAPLRPVHACTPGHPAHLLDWRCAQAYYHRRTSTSTALSAPSCHVGIAGHATP